MGVTVSKRRVRKSCIVMFGDFRIAGEMIQALVFCNKGQELDFNRAAEHNAMLIAKPMTLLRIAAKNTTKFLPAHIKPLYLDHMSSGHKSYVGSEM